VRALLHFTDERGSLGHGTALGGVTAKVRLPPNPHNAAGTWLPSPAFAGAA